MTPKICSVVSNVSGTSTRLKKLKSYEFVNWTTPDKYVDQGEHTLIYGYALAKSMFDHVSIGDYEITDRIRWTFNEFESPDDDYINEWIEETVKVFFYHERIDGSYDLDEQLSNVHVPFVYNGNHELYLLDATQKKCYSWSHEEIDYREGVSPEEFCTRIINWFLDQQLVVYAFNCENVDAANQDHSSIVFFVQDMIMSSTNTWITKNALKQTMKPFKLTTPEFMIYLSRMPNIYTNLDSHDYVTRYTSALVEQLFSEAQIHISKTKLVEKIRRENTAGGNAEELEKLNSAIDNLGNICVPYLSRNKVTGRLFPNKSVFNPVTVSNTDILESITSRFENGSIVVFDFKTFEPKIISKIINYNLENDLHQLAADILDCTRDEAKQINNMIFYGASATSIAKELNSLKVGAKIAERYLSMMTPILTGVNSYKLALEKEWEHTGYITTIYGRRVWVKTKSAILNNAIQAAASDTFNGVALRIFDLLRLYNSELFMHRFDSFYIDVHPDETEVVDEIADIMREGLDETIGFDVSIQAGRNLNQLKAI